MKYSKNIYKIPNPVLKSLGINSYTNQFRVVRNCGAGCRDLLQCVPGEKLDWRLTIGVAPGINTAAIYLHVCYQDQYGNCMGGG